MRGAPLHVDQRVFAGPLAQPVDLGQAAVAPASAAIRRGWSRVPCRLAPKGERTSIAMSTKAIAKAISAKK